MDDVGAYLSNLIHFHLIDLFHKSKNAHLLVNIHPEKFKIFTHNLCMKYLDSKKLSDSQFKRYTGISRSTFSLMVEQMQMQISPKGRPAKLCIEDQVLLCLSYWREYRTLFHIATSYAVSEPTASRIVRSGLFNLPKDIPEGEGIDWNVVIVDATEIPIQRPKKTEEKL